MNWLKDYLEDIMALAEAASDTPLIKINDEEQFKNFIEDAKIIFSPLEDGNLDPGDMDRIFELYWQKFNVSLIAIARKQATIQLRLTKLYEKLEKASDAEWVEYARMQLRSILQSQLMQAFMKKMCTDMPKPEIHPDKNISHQLESLITKHIPIKYDYLELDGSEIRLLAETDRGGLAHCTLPEAGISKAVNHKTVEEIWYFLSGKGEVWRKQTVGIESIDEVMQGISITIPRDTNFQFRNTGKEPLCFIITTMPPWPGSDEVIITKGIWQPTSPTSPLNPS
jgi:mannose-6-phosphate isomerase-like protein (cupin superfamily)